ncbi:MAG: hypothetical protein FWG64_14075 [Firmicutes bacterium]|nr:hypothetical protein [Bacillota bacterium]
MATYYELYMQCPVCISRGNNNIPMSSWVHNLDGGIIEVGDDANYRCKLCGLTLHISYWAYGCPNHSDDNEEVVYKDAIRPHHDKQFGFIAQLGIAARLSDQYSAQWLRNFVYNMSDW